MHSQVHGAFPVGFSTGTDLRIARICGHWLGRSHWLCRMNSQAKKYVAKTISTLYDAITHGLWKTCLLKFLLKNKGLIPHLKLNRAKLCVDVVFPSKWRPSPVVVISSSTFIFITLYCFKSFQNVFNAIYLIKNSSEIHKQSLWHVLGIGCKIPKYLIYLIDWFFNVLKGTKPNSI